MGPHGKAAPVISRERTPATKLDRFKGDGVGGLSKVLPCKSRQNLARFQQVAMLAAAKGRMISEDEARRTILESTRPLSARRVPLIDALDCFAAENYSARLSLPAFDNSAM